MAKIIRRPEVQKKIGLGHTALFERLNPKSPQYDATFPKPIKLGDSDNSPLGWLESEVEAWITKRFEQHRKAA